MAKEEPETPHSGRAETASGRAHAVHTHPHTSTHTRYTDWPWERTRREKEERVVDFASFSSHSPRLLVSLSYGRTKGHMEQKWGDPLGRAIRVHWRVRSGN